jgi:hypothetical protein
MPAARCAAGSFYTAVAHHCASPAAGVLKLKLVAFALEQRHHSQPAR